MLTKQEILLGKGPRVESSRVRKPRRAALPRGSQCTGGVSFKPFPNSSVGGGLLVPYSLSGSAVIKQLMQMVTMVPGQGGAVSVSVLPLTIPPARWGI